MIKLTETEQKACVCSRKLLKLILLQQIVSLYMVRWCAKAPKEGATWFETLKNKLPYFQAFYNKPQNVWLPWNVRHAWAAWLSTRSVFGRSTGLWRNEGMSADLQSVRHAKYLYNTILLYLDMLLGRLCDVTHKTLLAIACRSYVCRPLLWPHPIRNEQMFLAAFAASLLLLIIHSSIIAQTRKL